MAIVQCPAIVSREEFDKVQDLVAEQKRFSPRNTQRTYLLQHLAKCGVCGKPMYIALHGQRKYYYVCSSQRHRNQTGEDACLNRGVPVEILDNEVWKLISQMALKPASIQKMLAERQLRTRTSGQLDRLRKQEYDLLARQKKIMEFFTKGRIDDAQADESLKEIQQILKDVRREIAELNKDTHGQSVEQRTKNFIDALRNTDNQREACLKALSEVRITRIDNNRGRYAKLEMNVDIVPR